VLQEALEAELLVRLEAEHQVEGVVLPQQLVARPQGWTPLPEQERLS